jgi:hypothetical protein
VRSLLFAAHTHPSPPSYQLAVVNIDNINPQCSNLVPYSSICLGWAGEDCTTTYVVQLGDTCDEVAAAWGLNTTIFYLNNPQLNSDCTNLYIGEVCFFTRPSLHLTR